MSDDQRDNYYKLKVACANCGKGSAYDLEEYEILIPKGIKAEDFFQKTPCENCGCTTLTKIIPYVPPIIEVKEKKKKENDDDSEEKTNELNTDMPSIFKKKSKMRVKKIIK